MIFRPSLSRGWAGIGGLLLLTLSLLLGATAGSAFGAAPVNTALPTISPNPPKAASPETATTGTWNSEAPAHWYEGSRRLTEAEKLSVTAQGAPVTLAATIGGLPGSITCETSVSAASLENPTGGGAGVGNAEITYKNCVPSSPNGNWSGCTITAGPTVPVKLELGTLEGKAKVSILPVGGDLGTFTWSGAECNLSAKGTRKLIGAIKGFYSNAASQIEFDATSTSKALWFNSKEGPQVTATGAIGLKTTKGVSIAADSLSYAYQWKRCGANSCVAISGATAPTYTPVRADRWSYLAVSVTATDSLGSTTATSVEAGPVTASLSWYACGNWGSGGVYEDAECSKTGGSALYSWQRPSSMPVTLSNYLAGGTERSPITIGWITGGVEFKISCTESSGSGTVVNGSSQVTVENYKLTLGNCSFSGGGCQLESPTLTFNPMTGHAELGPSEKEYEPKRAFVMSPTEGVVLATVKLQGCPLIPQTLRGSLPVTFENSGSYITTNYAAVQESGLLRVNEASGPKAGVASKTRVLGEGSKPLKLDIAP